MAARTRKVRHDENTIAKIKASQLVNRLVSHVLGEVEMSPSQVTAGLGLLKKVIPDLSSVEHSGETTQHVISSQPLTDEEWVAEHATH